MTPEQQIAAALGLQQVPGVAGLEDYRTALGLSNEEREDHGMLASFLAGTATGFSDPLTLIPGVKEKVDFLQQYKGNDTRDKIAYGLGWIAGGLAPGAVTFKLGGLAARGLKLVKNVENAGEAVADLTRMGKLVRGGVAGAVWGAGQHAEDVGEWSEHVAVNAAMFGVGDLAIDGALRGLTRVFRRPGVKTVNPPEMVDAAVAISGDGATVAQSELMGRALSTIDDLIEREAPDLAGEALESRRYKMALGIQQMGLEEVQPGILKIVPSVGGDVNEIKAVLDGLGDFTYAISRRTIPVRDRTTGKIVQGQSRETVDFIVGRKGEFDYRIGDEFSKKGWFTGMEILWKGKKRVVVGGTKNADEVMAVSADNPNRQPHPILLSDAHILPRAHARNVPGLPDPDKWWARFVREYGDGVWTIESRKRVLDPATGLPTAEPLPGAEPTKKIFYSFAEQFGEFAEKYAIHGKTRQDLELFFARKQRELLKQVDPDLVEILENTARASIGNLAKAHPEGRLIEKASEKGFLQEWMRTDKGEWQIVLRSHANGSTFKFADREAAEAFLKNYAVEPGDVFNIPSPIASAAIHASEGGVAAQVSHTAGEASNFRRGFLFSLSEPWRPRANYLRSAEDHLRRQGALRITRKAKDGTESVTELHIWAGENGLGGFNNIDEQLTWLKNEMNGKVAPAGRQKRNWVEDLTKMRGGRYDLKSIRMDKLDDWWDVFERPKADIAKNAAAKGLTPEETKLVYGLRKYMDDLFERIGKEIDPEGGITGDEFVEEQLPFIRRQSSAKWPKALRQAYEAKGKKVSQNIMDMLEDGHNTGNLGSHERDPFLVALKLTRHGFFRARVQPHYEATLKMIGELDDKIYKNPEYADLAPISRSMRDYLMLTKGGLPEAYFAANEAIAVVAKQLKLDVSKTAFDRLINTMVSANYGAFMGLRIGMPIRNMTQMFVTTLPRVGSRNLSHGIEAVMRNPKAVWEKMYKYGALSEQGLPVATEDILHTRQIADMTALSDKTPEALGRLAKKLEKVGEYTTEAANVTLGGRPINIMGKEFYVGFFGKSDELLRGISYTAQEHKTIKAINGWKKHGWSIDKFNEEAGLTQFGETITAEFHRRMAGSQDDAIGFLAKQLSNETQYVYRLGAGPAMFSHGAGRLFGMYGTWPTWYADFLAHGLTTGTAKDKARFIGYSAAVQAAFMNAVYVTGVNLNRWTGLSSFNWAGSPFFDFFKDASTIWGGIQDDGTPTAARQLALGKRGLRDIGPEKMQERFGPLAGAVELIPGNPGALEVKDPYRLWEQTVGMFTPGMYAIRDAKDVAAALGDGDTGGAIIEAFGMKKANAVGHTWPEVQLGKGW